MLKVCIAGSQSHSCGTSLTTWDHTVLPATRHKWTHHALTPASNPVLDLPTQRDGRLIWPRLPSNAVAGVECATSQLQVQRPNHYNTEPPGHGYGFNLILIILQFGTFTE